jgi:uncharacterized protein YcbX
MSAHISALYFYPLKSAGRIAVNTLQLDAWGGVHDRHWMLVNSTGLALTQRDYGAIGQLQPQIDGDALVLHSNSVKSLRIPILRTAADVTLHDLQTTRAVVWGDDVPVIDAGDEASAWCESAIGAPCRLVQLAPWGRRPVAQKYAGPLAATDRHTTLSDGAPLLVLGDASLALLNEKLRKRGVAVVGAERFRANVMLADAAAHEEDTWSVVCIGDVTLAFGTTCARCVMTTIDQHTGQRGSRLASEAGGEPLRTLALYRRAGTGIMFGVNVTNATPGVLRLGDVVHVQQRRNTAVTG